MQIIAQPVVDNNESKPDKSKDNKISEIYAVSENDAFNFISFNTSDDQEPKGWKKTLSNAALGVAGAATAASLGALAFYAYHKLGADVSMIVEPHSIEGISGYGSEHIQSAVRGLGQIDAFISGLGASPQAKAVTMGDFFNQMQRSGVDPGIFKSTVASHANSLGVKNAAEWTERLTNPSTILTPAVRARVTELVWYHDKQVAIHSQNAQDAIIFVKAGLAVTLTGITSSLVDSVGKMKEFTQHMLGAARRVAVDSGLISESMDRRIRKIIKNTASDPLESRARLAFEYAERQTPMNRIFKLHWVEASRSGHREDMLALFGLESRLVGGHSAVGQNVLIDNFSASELRDIASRETVHGKFLSQLADRKSILERQGMRAKSKTEKNTEEIFDNDRKFSTSTINHILEASIRDSRVGQKNSRAPVIR